LPSFRSNSIDGRVADLHSLLPTKLKIAADFQRVEHCLVALPGATPKSIRTVKSRVQALAHAAILKHRLRR
jgi:prephenate dehydratase